MPSYPARTATNSFGRSAHRSVKGRLRVSVDQAVSPVLVVLPAMAGSRVLTVGVGPTFATRWLIPRLANFQKKEPDIEVRFATGGARKSPKAAPRFARTRFVMAVSISA